MPRPRASDARFEVADAMNLGDRAALRHDRRQRAVPHLRRRRPAEIRRQPAHRVPAGRHRARARALRRGPRIRAARSATRSIREAFADGWVLEALDTDHLSRRRHRGARRGARLCRSAPASTSPRGWRGLAGCDRRGVTRTRRHCHLRRIRGGRSPSRCRTSVRRHGSTSPALSVEIAGADGGRQLRLRRRSRARPARR